ncbi:cytochrome O ubiquinol oxidase [Buchnera aphidicola (Aphis glycines)]|uniref:Cytochrome bo(3) ubiquinol oxidase subunit 4 n=1 Tax=Buchnera aphidicola (Aphis glycines) TaxID=1265350 RepID=A0A0M3RSL0_9GAMM|nr:cytochrome o ubiquinol oxidase subunit IV [Buchnera aphidicola]ALD15396.1 cytochrome O ubiquinol oxidase [Buchnera aphidicola (Aphis glycines)]
MSQFFQKKHCFDEKVKSYIFGFLLSVLFTIIPFFIEKNHVFSYKISRFIILFCAFFQIIIHFIYFLHLNNISKNNWYLMSLLFVFIIVFIVISGSVWIMFNLQHHAMV